MTHQQTIYENFLSTWPIERFQQMTLEEYTNLEKNSFCYSLEVVTQDLGSIWGGSSYKFGIYRRRNTDKDINRPGYLYDADYSWLRKYGDTAETAFNKIKAIIVGIADAARQGKYSEIEAADLGFAYKWKIAFLYSDLKLVNLFRLDAIRKVAAHFNHPAASNASVADLQTFIKRQQQPGEDTWAFGGRLWDIYQDTAPANFAPRNFYKYSPGVNAVRWQDDLKAGSIRINFQDFEVGSLNDYATNKELAETMGLTTAMSNAILNLWTFKETYPGEIVIANRGLNTVLGFGVVLESYEYLDNEPDFRHSIKVKWLANKEWDYVPSTIPNYTTAFRPDTYTKCKIGRELASLYLTAYPEYIDVFKKYGMEILPDVQLPPVTKPEANSTKSPIKKAISMTDQPLNQILYGPPGTGKTYNTTRIAYEIVNGEPAASYDDACAFFKGELQREERHRRIEFITFHQNYSYEDFLIGIRPNIDDNASLGFRRNEGVFYKICTRARENWLKSQTTERYEPSFEDVYDEFFREMIENGSTISIQMKDPNYHFSLTYRDDNSLQITKKEGSTTHNIVKSTLKGLYEGTRSIKGGMMAYYGPVIEQLKKKAKELSGTSMKEERENFVIIIDEINRANISRVFGELITLIEEDKRLGKPHHLKLQLPSGEYFDVPENLYIVGTMNTADKSISLIDIALRRRFEFVGYYPNYDVLDDGYEHHKELLQTINREIYERKKTADYLVGHAYFMSDGTPESILKRKVIPLLMEYFSGKTEEVRAIFKNTKYQVDYDDTQFVWKVTRKKPVHEPVL